MTALRYNDWDITNKHAEIVDGLKPAGLRPSQVHTTIPGVINRRLTGDLREGVYLMPLESPIGLTYSSVHDVNRRSLLVASIGKSTTQSKGTPLLMQLLEAIRTAFASRRVVRLPGELYSSHEIASYDVDDQLARKADVIQVILTTRFREDR
jgi:hypothetical protein